MLRDMQGRPLKKRSSRLPWQSADYSRVNSGDDGHFNRFLALANQCATTEFVDALERYGTDSVGANWIGPLATRLVEKQLYPDFIKLLTLIRDVPLLFAQIVRSKHLYPVADGLVDRKHEAMARQFLKALRAEEKDPVKQLIEKAFPALKKEGPVTTALLPS